MSRRRARELAFHMIFENEASDAIAEDMLKIRLRGEYFESLASECSVYSVAVTEDQEDYITNAVSGVIANKEELNSYIEKYSVGWNISRISKVARSLIKLCMYEMKYMGIPVGASVNEALELVKKYDSDEAAPFVNGVLASFIKNELKND